MMIESLQSKLVVVGDGGVGKTSLIKRHRTGEFERKYIPTLGVEITYLTFSTTQGLLTFEIWDTAGQERFGGLREGYYIDAQCAIIMFDLTSLASYRNVPSWHKDLVRVCPGIPVVLVGSKADVPERAVSRKRIAFHVKHEMNYFEVSAKSNYHFELPFLSLARRLTDDPNLAFVAAPVLLPPDVALDATVIEQYERELAQAGEVPLPEDVDDIE
jgi:GTP-binding nuclear protein Ran